jgi:hypothetical protein
MTFLDRLFVFFASVFVGLFLFSIVGSELLLAVPILGVLFVLLGGKRR